MNLSMRHYTLQFGTSFRSVLLLMIVSVLAGCATPATFEGMVPDSYEIIKKRPDSVSVKVTGGQETSAMWKTQISNDAFAQALVEAIGKSQTFSKVIQGSGADYLLTVNLFSMEQPTFGGAFTVKMEAGWALKRADSGATVWQEAIRSEYTATMGEAFVGSKRLRLATEGAARKNIAEGLAKISKLNL